MLHRSHIDGLLHIAAARELRPLLAHPGFEIGNERPAQFLADGAASVGALLVDASLDLEQGIDTTPALAFRLDHAHYRSRVSGRQINGKK